jgi:hypothetical protein
MRPYKDSPDTKLVKSSVFEQNSNGFKSMLTIKASLQSKNDSSLGTIHTSTYQKKGRHHMPNSSLSLSKQRQNTIEDHSTKSNLNFSQITLQPLALDRSSILNLRGDLGSTKNNLPEKFERFSTVGASSICDL